MTFIKSVTAPNISLLVECISDEREGADIEWILWNRPDIVVASINWCDAVIQIGNIEEGTSIMSLI